MANDRAGLTDVFDTGIVIMWTSASPRPAAIGPKPVGTPLRLVVPSTISTKTAVMTISMIATDSRSKPPGECVAVAVRCEAVVLGGLEVPVGATQDQRQDAGADDATDELRRRSTGIDLTGSSFLAMTMPMVTAGLMWHPEMRPIR